MRRVNSIHAVVTDPAYGRLESTTVDLEKMKRGRGGGWRIPPAYDGAKRRPLPRFTVLRRRDKLALRDFFRRLGEGLLPLLVPGAPVLSATKPPVSHPGFWPRIEAGL